LGGRSWKTFFFGFFYRFFLFLFAPTLAILLVLVLVLFLWFPGVAVERARGFRDRPRVRSIIEEVRT